MAYIGLAYPTIAKLNVETGAYTDGFTMGKAVDVNITPNYNEAKLPGDNITAEVVKEFRDANVELGITTIPVEAYETVFGHTVAEAEGSTTITDKSDDNPNYVGVGLVKEEIVDGAKKYIAFWIFKALFTEGADSATTKGDTITFQTPRISGVAVAMDNKEWRERKIFTTEAAAKAYIQTKAGIAA